MKLRSCIRNSLPALRMLMHAQTLSGTAGDSRVPFIDTIRAARERTVAQTDAEREPFLRKPRYWMTETRRTGETGRTEKDHPPEPIFGFFQTVTGTGDWR